VGTEFDPAKDEANIVKHGVSISLRRAHRKEMRRYGF